MLWNNVYVLPSTLFLFRVNTVYKINVSIALCESSGSYNDNYVLNNSEMFMSITAGHQGGR